MSTEGERRSAPPGTHTAGDVGGCKAVSGRPGSRDGPGPSLRWGLARKCRRSVRSGEVNLDFGPVSEYLLELVRHRKIGSSSRREALLLLDKGGRPSLSCRRSGGPGAGASLAWGSMGRVEQPRQSRVGPGLPDEGGLHVNMRRANPRRAQWYQLPRRSSGRGQRGWSGYRGAPGRARALLCAAARRTDPGRRRHPLPSQSRRPG